MNVTIVLNIFKKKMILVSICGEIDNKTLKVN